MTEAWAAIIAAIIGVLGTLLVTKFDAIANLLRGSPRNIAGEWEVTSYRVETANETQAKRVWIGEYVVSLKQMGRKIKGEMIATKTTDNFKLYKYVWEGELRDDYLVYKCIGTETAQSMLSTALMYVHTTGEEMKGYFVNKSGMVEPERTWVGYAEMKKRK